MWERIKLRKNTDRLDDKHWFIHEMVHVWQYQNGNNLVRCASCELPLGYVLKVSSPDSPWDEDLKTYKTDVLGVDRGKKFKDFRFEQQARLIALFYDAIYMQKDEPSRKHHQKAKLLQGYLEVILRDFLLDKSLGKKSHLPSCMERETDSSSIIGY